MSIGGPPMTVWCEPLLHGGMKLAPGDIEDALTWFKETIGQDARLIVLNPKNERYAKEVPEKTVVEYLDGCLTWEVWLSPQVFLGDKTTKEVAEYPNGIMATVKDEKSTVAIIQSSPPKVTREKRGPKYRVLPIELIIQWASEGMGYKRITARLKTELDINVGFRTIARIIKGERLLL